jgi:hypothetical protein
MIATIYPEQVTAGNNKTCSYSAKSASTFTICSSSVIGAGYCLSDHKGQASTSLFVPQQPQGCYFYPIVVVKTVSAPSPPLPTKSGAAQLHVHPLLGTPPPPLAPSLHVGTSFSQFIMVFQTTTKNYRSKLILTPLSISWTKKPGISGRHARQSPCSPSAWRTETSLHHHTSHDSQRHHKSRQASLTTILLPTQHRQYSPPTTLPSIIPSDHIVAEGIERATAS